MDLGDPKKFPKPPTTHSLLVAICSLNQSIAVSTPLLFNSASWKLRSQRDTIVPPCSQLDLTVQCCHEVISEKGKCSLPSPWNSQVLVGSIQPQYWQPYKKKSSPSGIPVTSHEGLQMGNAALWKETRNLCSRQSTGIMWSKCPVPVNSFAAIFGTNCIFLNSLQRL